MDGFAVAFKAAITAFFAWLSAKLGILVPVMGLLVLVMTLDFLTGWGASIVNGQPITSKKGMQGIIKKLFYIVGVICGLAADWLIITLANTAGIQAPFHTFFGLLVAVWLILNEIVSILENIARSGVNMPPFLLSVVKLLKIKVEEKGETDNEQP
jgi:toxin secretion/phage lysis holin